MTQALPPFAVQGVPQRILVISHVRDDSGANGGAAYTNSLVDMLRQIAGEVRVIFVFEQAPRWRRLRIAYALVRSLFSGVPAKVEYFRRRGPRARIAASLSQWAPELVVFDHLETLLYAPLARKSPRHPKTLLVQHNDEAALYADRVARMTPRWLAGLARGERARLARFQAAAYRDCRDAVFLSTDEARRALGSGVRRAWTLAPSFGYAPVGAACRDDGRVHLLFVGAMSWWPNEDAIAWFVEQVFANVPSYLVLHLVGRGSERWRDCHPRIVAHGFVPERADAWGLAPLFVAPVRCGAGVNIKVAEAIHNGRALLATPQALRGLPLVADPAIVVLSTATDWIGFLSDRPALAALARKAPHEDNRSLFERDAVRRRLADYVARIEQA